MFDWILRHIKGTKLWPYDDDEFPRYHVHGCSKTELDALEEVWRKNPQLRGETAGDHPNWDEIFNLAGIEIEEVPDTSQPDQLNSPKRWYSVCLACCDPSKPKEIMAEAANIVAPSPDLALERAVKRAETHLGLPPYILSYKVDELPFEFVESAYHELLGRRQDAGFEVNIPKKLTQSDLFLKFLSDACLALGPKRATHARQGKFFYPRVLEQLQQGVEHPAQWALAYHFDTDTPRHSVLVMLSQVDAWFVLVTDEEFQNDDPYNYIDMARVVGMSPRYALEDLSLQLFDEWVAGADLKTSLIGAENNGN